MPFLVSGYIFYPKDSEDVAWAGFPVLVQSHTSGTKQDSFSTDCRRATKALGDPTGGLTLAIFGNI